MATQGGIIVEPTSTEPEKITLPDVDYIYWLVMTDLTNAIKDLTEVMRQPR